MNWDAISFDWNQARAFLATAEEGSLSAAARALRQTQPTLGRQIAALEADLGVVLFERVGRTYVPTPTGLDLLEHVRSMASAATQLSLTASGQAQAIEGTVVISVSDVMAAYMLPPMIRELGETAPGLHIDLLASNTFSDLKQREADIALRHVRPEQPELIAKFVKEMTARHYAAPSYLQVHGRPSEMAELAQHSFISFGDREQMKRQLESAKILISDTNLRFSSASAIVAWQMVRDGLGVGIMADEIADKCPDVEPLFPDVPPFRFPLWIVTHRELKTSRRIRLVFDFLAEKLK